MEGACSPCTTHGGSRRLWYKGCGRGEGALVILNRKSRRRGRPAAGRRWRVLYLCDFLGLVSSRCFLFYSVCRDTLVSFFFAFAYTFSKNRFSSLCACLPAASVHFIVSLRLFFYCLLFPFVYSINLFDDSSIIFHAFVDPCRALQRFELSRVFNNPQTRFPRCFFLQSKYVAATTEILVLRSRNGFAFLESYYRRVTRFLLLHFPLWWRIVYPPLDPSATRESTKLYKLFFYRMPIHESYSI